MALNNSRLHIIRKDPNWDRNNTQTGTWSSRLPGYSPTATGTLDLGYFQRTSYSQKAIWVPIGGGGNITMGSTLGIRLFQKTPEVQLNETLLSGLLGGALVNDCRRTCPVSLREAPLNVDLFLRIFDENTNDDPWAHIQVHPMGIFLS